MLSAKCILKFKMASELEIGTVYRPRLSPLILETLIWQDMSPRTFWPDEELYRVMALGWGTPFTE